MSVNKTHEIAGKGFYVLTKANGAIGFKPFFRITYGSYKPYDGAPTEFYCSTRVEGGRGFTSQHYLSREFEDKEMAKQHLLLVIEGFEDWMRKIEGNKIVKSETILL